MQRIINLPDVPEGLAVGTSSTIHQKTYLTNRRWLLTGLLLVGLNTLSPAQCWKSVVNFIGPDITSIAAGDFNGDGNSDLAVTNFSDNTITVVLNDGKGSFKGIGTTVGGRVELKNTYAVGAAPIAIAVGYFNADIKLDIVVANSAQHTISVLINKGGGDFLPAVNYASGIDPRSIVTGDINMDGTYDVAVTNSGGTVNMLIGKGNGQFFPATHVQVGADPVSLVLVDINNDGKTDIATADFTAGTVSVRFGGGTGGFGSLYTYTVGKQPRSIASQDMNGDGRKDLVVALQGENNLAILAGGPGGLFYPPTKVGTGYLPMAVALADLNQDGQVDIVATNYNSNDVRVYLNSNGAFVPTPPIPVLAGPHAVVIGFLDGDGKQDLAVASINTSYVKIITQTYCPVARVGVDEPGLLRMTENAVLEPGMAFGAVIMPNPVEDDLQVRIDGASGQTVRLWLVDVQGRTVVDRQIQVAENRHTESIPVGEKETGTYLLKVSTGIESKTLKVLKR